MEMLRINATRDGALVAAALPTAQGAAAGRPSTRATQRQGTEQGTAGTGDWEAALRRALDGVAPGGRVILLVHGYRFTWMPNAAGLAPHCPQDRLYGTGQPVTRQGVWPRRAAWFQGLRSALDEAGPGDGVVPGLCIGFGWDGRRGTVGHLLRTGRPDFAQVYHGAGIAGAALARVLSAIARHRPDLAPGFFAHSLGARVVLTAMREAAGARLGRALLLGAAEYVECAHATLAAQRRAGGGAEIYHVLSRANDPFDAAFARLAPRPGGGRGITLGRGGLVTTREAEPGAQRRWIDLQLDGRAMAAHLACRGMPLSRRGERVSHWHFYTDEGAMRAWAAILHHRPGWDIASLRAAGLDGALDPRWSRVLPALLRGPARPSGGIGRDEDAGIAGA